MGVLTKFYVKAGEGDHVDTVVHLKPDNRGIITGRILDDGGKPAGGVCVLLYDTMGKKEFADYTLVDSMFSDSDGTFMLGPIIGGTLYVVYVYSHGIRTRQLELRA